MKRFFVLLSISVVFAQQQETDYFYNNGNSFVGFQQGQNARPINYYATSAAFRGTPPPTYQQQDEYVASQPSPYQIPPQYDPYQRTQQGFQTNQHLPQPFHPQTRRFPFESSQIDLQNFQDYEDKVKTTANYFNVRHPQGIVDQLDSNRWRNTPKRKPYEETTLVPVSSTAGYFQAVQERKPLRDHIEPIRTPVRENTRDILREPIRNNEEPKIIRGNTRYKDIRGEATTLRPRTRKPEIKRITTTTTTTTTPEPFDPTNEDYELEYILSEEPGDTEDTFEDSAFPIIKPNFKLNTTKFDPSRIKYEDVSAFLPPGYKEKFSLKTHEVKTTTTTTTPKPTSKRILHTYTTRKATPPPTTTTTTTTTTTPPPTTTTTTTTTPRPTTTRKPITRKPTTTTTPTSSQENSPSSEEQESPTESWVIVASVQTSRSVSGARFLPGHINQEEVPKILTSNGTLEKEIPAVNETKEISGKEATPKPSTESIIDKLDRVQSELSSGILNGFRPGDSNLELPDMPENKTLNAVTSTTQAPPTVTTEATTTTTTTTTTTQPTTTTTKEPIAPRRFVPAGKRTTIKPKKSLIENIQFDDLSGLLPPGFKARDPPKESNREGSARSAGSTFKNRVNKEETKDSKGALESGLGKITFEDVSSLLPPGYSPDNKNKTSVKTSQIPSSLLPPGFKPSKDIPIVPVEVNIPSNLLPPGFKLDKVEKEEPKKDDLLASILKKVEIKEASLLPPGYKANTTEKAVVSSTESSKPVFPTRPGGRKPPPPRTKSGGGLSPVAPKIQKGWPVRASTEFTGWPSSSTTPVSIEKILEEARKNSAKIVAAEVLRTSTEADEVTIDAHSTSTTTTTTRRPTTPGICEKDCDMAATVRLVGGAKWVPELLDHNTKEWRDLANEVESQLETIYSSSDSLSKWYKKITIDAFSEGSVLVDYFVELTDLGRTVNTADMKRLFHESLAKYTSNQAALSENENRISNTTEYKLGKYTIDPNYTDFIVLPRQVLPTVGYAEENELLPQWAIAVIVIGLASLLFVIIFGVTVLVNRHKSAKKKQPTTLSEDMLHELNKNHMGGLDNYGADDLYNMEDVWNDKPPKKRSAGSIQENSMANLYDSWRSEWNGYYYNAYYGGNGGGSSGSGYGGRRRSDYDTNF